MLPKITLISVLCLFSCDSTFTVMDSVQEKESSASTCDSSIIETTPYPDAQDVYYLAPLSIVLSKPDTNATLSLRQGGQVISGSLTTDGNELTFIPNEPLLPNTFYDVSISYCGSPDSVTYSFLTSSLGEPLEGGISTLSNHSYMIDLHMGEVIKPLGIGDFLQTLLNHKFLIDVQSIENTNVSVRMALSKAQKNEQNYCVPTIEEFPIIDLSEEPFFTLYSPTIPILISEYQLNIYDFETYGTIEKTASEFAYMHASGALDVREVFPILQDFTLNADTVDEFVHYLRNLNVEITPCTDGAEYCMPIVMNNLFAEEIDEEIQPICSANCHELCSSNIDSCLEPQSIWETCPQ